MRENLDDLLYASAEIKTKELRLDTLLDTIKQTAPKPVSTPFRRVRYFALAAACFCVLLAGAWLLMQTVVVEGKTYIVMGGKVFIDGQTYSLQKPAEEEARLIQLQGNQYAVLPGEDAFAARTKRIMVFAPDAPEQAIVNPNAQAGTEVFSVEPVVVYPVVGDLVVRKGPSAQSEELSMLHAGQCVVKVGMYENWAAIEWEGGVAYAFNAYLFEAPQTLPTYPAVEKYAVVALNIRSLPTSRAESAVLGELKENERVLCTGTIGPWSQIEYGDKSAYVFSKYLSDQPS